MVFKGNYLREGRARDDHWENVLGRIDLELDECWSWLIDGPLDRRSNLVWALDAPARNSIGIGEFDEVGRARQVHFDVVLVVKELLPLPDHAQILIVEQGDLDRQIELADDRQLLTGHL